MRQLRCRKCWQSLPIFAKRCPQCGHVDRARGQGLAELVFGVMVMVMGLVAWLAGRLFLS